MQKTVFVVDDNITNLTMAKSALSDYYAVITMPSAAKLFSILEKKKPDIILLDIEMPEMNGFEALAKLKSNEKHVDIPVIFLTSLTDESVEVRGFQLGVVDFINKPFSGPVLTNRLKTHLDIDELIRERTAQLEESSAQLRKKTIQLQTLQNGIVFVLADMVERRDENTGGHIERTAAYLELLMTEMINTGVYADQLKEMNLDLVISSSRLHDVGKIAISDVILNKPDKLSADEYELMKTHCDEGEYVINQIITRTDDVEFLRNAMQFAGAHHERWDGNGYPRGLSKTDVPLLGRVMAFVDVYDALVSDRPYKKAFSHDEAVNIIMKSAGSHFDPELIKVFASIHERFKAVSDGNVIIPPSEKICEQILSDTP